MSCNKVNLWSKEEDEILNKHYAKLGAKGCKELGINRSLAAIKVRANSRGIKREREYSGKQPRWCERDLKILRKYFKKEGIRGVINRGVIKSPTLICLEAKKLGLYE